MYTAPTPIPGPHPTTKPKTADITLETITDLQSAGELSSSHADCLIQGIPQEEKLLARGDKVLALYLLLLFEKHKQLSKPPPPDFKSCPQNELIYQK